MSGPPSTDAYTSYDATCDAGWPLQRTVNAPAGDVDGAVTVPDSGGDATATLNPLKSISGDGESSVTLIVYRADRGELAGMYVKRPESGAIVATGGPPGIRL